MGARSGNNYLSALRRLKAEVWIGGARVADPTIHPMLVHRARMIASLYDLQMEHPGAMTYRLEDGDRVGISFIQPSSRAELLSRGAMFRRWASYSGGLLRDTPDGCNAALAAMAAAKDFFATADSRFGTNVQDYYRNARRQDWCAAHTLIAPYSNAGGEEVGPAAADNPLAVAESVAEGLLVSGTRPVSPLAPLAEELIVFAPPGPPDQSVPAERSAPAFAINCNARGLKLICAAPKDSPGRPATERRSFEEMACTAIFDRMLIPWERVFLFGDLARRRAMLDETGATLNLLHRQTVRSAAAAEFRLGRVANLVDRCGALTFPPIRAQLIEQAWATHLASILIHAAEVGAPTDRWGQALPQSAPLALASELLQQLERAV
jgi:aromatic ring hydroxylase